MYRYVLQRRLHASWLIALSAIMILLGVTFAQSVPPGWFASLIWCVTALSLLALVLWRQNVYLLPLLLIGGLFLGLWRGSLEQHDLLQYDALYGHIVSLGGTVVDDTDTGKQGELVIKLKDIAVGEHTLKGQIWISLATKQADIKRSDRVVVQGKLQAGFGNLAATMYRAQLQHVARPQPGDIALRVRDWFSDAVRKSIPEPQASLGIGYLVGQRRSLPPELETALKVAGLTHIVVASGYNLTILVRLARRLFEKVSKYLSALAASSMIVAFVAVTGLSPSMSRAGLVASLSLLAWYYGRKFHPLVLLPFAAAVTVIVNPSYAWGDIGWQLSFAAFGGVMILAPLLQRYFFGDKKPGTIRQILGETVAAQLVTFPILIMMFGQFSNVAIVSNILILPLVPLAMLLTFIAGVGALVFPPLAVIVGMPAHGLLAYMTWTTERLASLSWAQSAVSLGAVGIAVCYVLIASGCIYMWRKTQFDFRNTNLVE